MTVGVAPLLIRPLGLAASATAEAPIALGISAFGLGYGIGTLIVDCFPILAPPAPSHTTTGSGSTNRGRSFDPNAMVGPTAYGTDDFVTASSVLPYTIDFENSSTATASAAVIQITQQLSANVDWSTFQLGDIELGSLDIAIPAGMTSLNETFDERSTLGIYVQVVAGLNANTGVVTWTLTALDPTTMQVPEDPLLGLLPPDLLPPEGDGSVSYTVQPKASDTTGTIINAQASIIFDLNAPHCHPADLRHARRRSGHQLHQPLAGHRNLGQLPRELDGPGRPRRLGHWLL